jgi:hypothetical protein
MYLDGELVGFGRTYHEAEVTLDQLVFELMSGTYFQSPTPKPPACPSCGDAVRKAGACAACREAGENLDAVADCAAYSDDIHIPARTLDGQCACGTTLNEHGQCERCIEEAEQTRDRDAEADGPEPWAVDLVRAVFTCGACRGEHHIQSCGEVRALLFADEPLLVEVPYVALEA